MELIERVVGDVTVVTLKGRLIFEEVEASLRAAIDGLIAEERYKLVLDLLNVTYIDSAGLGFLVSKYVTLQRLGGDLKLVHLTERSSHVLEITHLVRIFDTFDSESEAIRSFDSKTGRGSSQRLPART